MSPMCQYSAIEGVAQDWHFIHYGARATGGVGAIIVEATAVSPEGRISSADLGLWSSKQVDSLKPIVNFVHSQNCSIGVQLAHAGRKASVDVAWKGGVPLSLSQGGWLPVAPSAIAFSEHFPVPSVLDNSGLDKIIQQFSEATERAMECDFDFVEIHMAHGYLLHEFLSPLSNHRMDEYGGNLENRMRFPLLIAERVRKIWPQDKPVFVRISASDWVENGWDLKQSLEFCKQLKNLGIDLIDVSSGGLVPYAQIPMASHYQVPFAAAIKQETRLMTAAVGLITDPIEANKLIENNQCDVVLLGRELLRNSEWPLQAALKLKQHHEWPVQYLRSKI